MFRVGALRHVYWRNTGAGWKGTEACLWAEHLCMFRVGELMHVYERNTGACLGWGTDGCFGCGRFGRGANLYRHRSQLFGRLWVRLPLPTGQFSEIYNVRRGWFTGIELVLDPTTWVHFLLVRFDSSV